MSYNPDFGTASYTGDFNAVESTNQLEPLNLGPNIFLAQPGDLPPEVMQSKVPTVRHLRNILSHLNIKLKIFLLKLLRLELNQFSLQVLPLLIYLISKRDEFLYTR